MGLVSDGKRLSVIIPAYNEVQTIGEVIRRVEKLDLGEIEREIIVVDGGSSDGTREILEQLQADGRLIVLDERPRKGKGHAIRLGLRRATGAFIIFQDADLELDPKEYPILLQPIVRGEADVVYGSRFQAGWRRGIWLNRWANRAITGLVNLLYGSDLTDVETCYKLFRAEVIKGLTLTSNRFDLDPEITVRLLNAGTRICEVPIEYFPRTVQQGKKLRWTAGFDALKVIFRHWVASWRRRVAKGKGFS